MLSSIAIWKHAVRLLALASILFVSASARATGTIDDWWICVEGCADEDPYCVDACTDKYNEAPSVEQCARTLGYRLEGAKPVPLILRARSATTRYVKPTGFLGACPAGTSPWPFEMPIYDAKGLFVIGFKTVFFCIDNDLEPAG